MFQPGRLQIVLNLIVGLFLLVIPTILAFKKMPTEAAVVTASACLLLAFLNISLFETVKMPAFEAKLREAKSSVEEAHEMLGQAKRIAAGLAELMLKDIGSNLQLAYDPAAIKPESSKEKIDALIARRNEAIKLVENIDPGSAINLKKKFDSSVEIFISERIRKGWVGYVPFNLAMVAGDEKLKEGISEAYKRHDKSEIVRLGIEWTKVNPQATSYVKEMLFNIDALELWRDS